MKAQARKLLAEAGYGPSKPLRVEMVTRAVAVYVDMASFVINELKQVGVEATLRQVETAQWRSVRAATPHAPASDLMQGPPRRVYNRAVMARRRVAARSAPTGNDGAGKRRARAAPALPDLSQYGRLAEYNRKRHFGVTPEPPGRAATRTPGHPLQFVVQKHRASRLHYDFRLEHRGVMLSWAVPKGPSPDPAVKRLAMEVEPHPMDYNQFEGVIPEREYGGGVVMIWDKGVWAPFTPTGLGDEAEAGRQIAKGELKFVLLGDKLKGSWVLVRTRGSRQWLLIKHRDEYASAEDVAVSSPRSAVSGRTMAEIAVAAGATPRQFEQAAATDPPGVNRAAAASPATRTRRAPSPTRGPRPGARAGAR